MNEFDKLILEFFNRFSQRSWTFDKAIHLLTDTTLFRGGVVVAILWILWITDDEKKVATETRRTILATFAGSSVAVLLARGLATILPFRFRPLNQPGLNFILPFGIHPEELDRWSSWSSFPSDHATLFAGLVTGIFLISRPFGFFSFIYVFLVVLIPRIYLGMHYPTDILAGILLGCAFVLLANRSKIKILLTDPLIEWSEKYPRLFYGIFFLFLYQTAELYQDPLRFGKALLIVAEKIVHGIL